MNPRRPGFAPRQEGRAGARMTVKTREITLRVPDDVLLAVGTEPRLWPRRRGPSRPSTCSPQAGCPRARRRGWRACPGSISFSRPPGAASTGCPIPTKTCGARSSNTTLPLDLVALRNNGLGLIFKSYEIVLGFSPKTDFKVWR